MIPHSPKVSPRSCGRSPFIPARSDGGFSFSSTNNGIMQISHKLQLQRSNLKEQGGRGGDSAKLATSHRCLFECDSAGRRFTPPPPGTSGTSVRFCFSWGGRGGSVCFREGGKAGNRFSHVNGLHVTLSQAVRSMHFNS